MLILQCWWSLAYFFDLRTLLHLCRLWLKRSLFAWHAMMKIVITTGIVQFCCQYFYSLHFGTRRSCVCDPHIHRLSLEKRSNITFLLCLSIWTDFDKKKWLTCTEISTLQNCKVPTSCKIGYVLALPWEVWSKLPRKWKFSVHTNSSPTWILFVRGWPKIRMIMILSEHLFCCKLFAPNG